MTPVRIVSEMWSSNKMCLNVLIILIPDCEMPVLIILHLVIEDLD